MAYTVPKLRDFSPATLDKAAEKLLEALVHDSSAVKNEVEWKAFRDHWMARKDGVLTNLNDLWLKAAPKDAKRDVGQRVNELKKKVEEEVDAAKQKAERASAGSQSDGDRLDITLPGIQRPIGAEHPIIRTSNEMVAVFRDLGYSVQEGPEIETDYYNFESLNFPPNHPA
ncbi:MAG: phenylalanine--tRNA ligase subunit alpha, partial [Acidobacteriaceae bacterium]|nr:phenylalanine--tRNA ligase subunit alpha [Acidobacteriaceae bacterium]